MNTLTRYAAAATNGDDADTLIDRAKQHGLDAVELRWKSIDPRNLSVLTGARSSGVNVAAIDLGVVDADHDPRADLPNLLSAANATSCRRLLLTQRRAAGGADAEARAWFVTMLRQLAEQCEAPGLSLVVRVARSGETESGLTSTADLREVLAAVNRGNVAAETDLSAMLTGGEDAQRSTDSLVGRVGYARLGDRAAELDTDVIGAFLADLQVYGYGDVVAVPADAKLGELLDSIGTSVTFDADRLAKFQQTLVENNLDGAVMLSAENVVSVSGYWPMNGTCVAVVPRSGEPHLLVPAGEEFWAARSGWANLHMYQAGRIGDPSLADTVASQLRRLRDTGVISGRRIGVEGPFRAQVPPHMAHEVSGRHEIIRPVVASALDAETVFFDAALCRSRAAKTTAELAALRRTAAIADIGLQTFRDGLRDGVRDIDLATEVERAIETQGVGHLGASRVRGYAFVMSGPQTSQCHLDYEFSSTRRMRDGEWILMELAVVADGYWQDLSRVFVLGDPTDQQREIAETAETAFVAAARAAVPGATGAEVDDAARRAIDAAGMGEAYPHQTGHGVGIAFHEQYPLLKPGSTHVLEEGNVIAIEPGVYVPGVGGVRNEDDLVVGSADGATTLQSVPHAVSVSGSRR
ncbi:M24 family metallopeptidase [Mycolicibacterium sp. 624]|uniref:M24 family metallopeptidase n=1 Tax=Mycolicibacterium sp. 624 TaxID=3156314 RepID=UPI003390C354